MSDKIGHLIEESFCVSQTGSVKTGDKCEGQTRTDGMTNWSMTTSTTSATSGLKCLPKM